MQAHIRKPDKVLQSKVELATSDEQLEASKGVGDNRQHLSEDVEAVTTVVQSLRLNQ